MSHYRPGDAGLANCKVIAEKLRLDVCLLVRGRDPRRRFDVRGLRALYRPRKNTTVYGMNRMRSNVA